MNKKSRKRAFFVYVIICLIYICVAFRLTEKVSMQRTTDVQAAPSRGMMVPAPGESNDVSEPRVETVKEPTPEPVRPTTQIESVAGEQSAMEPSLLISIPVICYAIKEGWVEKEGLIFSKKDAYNNVSWKKPIEILKDHDEDGIRNILNTIGNKRVLEFIRREGITAGTGLSAEDIILGRGYTVDRQKLVALYDVYVSKGYDELFPFSVQQGGMVKSASGFQLRQGRELPKEAHKAAETEWMMPNLTNLPIKVAVEKLSTHTSRIKVYGNGYVMSQSPRALERLKGERECTIQGRSQSQ